MISVIIPCYNEEDTISILLAELNMLAKEFRARYDEEFEILCIDSGSTDGTLQRLKDAVYTEFNTKYISFSSNFGKEAAIFAGLQNSSGDYIVIMDADMQDPPMMIETMYKNIITGEYDCIATKRSNRTGEPIIRSILSQAFYRIFNKVSDTKIETNSRDFRMMTRQMVDAILQVTEHNRFSKGIFSWVGFNTKYIEYNNIERLSGKTKWSIESLSRYAVDGIVSFSTLPLDIILVIGLLTIIISIIVIIYDIIKALSMGGHINPIYVLINLIGINLFGIGALGQYISRIQIEVKNRPIYLVKETNIKLKVNRNN